MTEPAGSPEDTRLPPRARRTHWTLFIALALTVAGLDLWTKQAVFKWMGVEVKDGAVQHHAPVVIIPNFFELEGNINYGAFSGWFAQHTGFLSLLSLAALGVIAGILWRELRGPGPHRLWFTAALGLLWGGTFGNLYDRAVLGYVRDFIKWFVVIDGRSHVWPNFNLADSAICVGVGIIVVTFLFAGNPGAKQTQAAG